jgi:putative iron-only hydrogenase system regulator
MDKRIGTITIIITNRASQAARVNAILSEYGDAVIGRMGIPYPPRELHIIALIVHASTDVIGAMTGKLGALGGVEVKSALTRV